MEYFLLLFNAILIYLEVVHDLSPKIKFINKG